MSAPARRPGSALLPFAAALGLALIPCAYTPLNSDLGWTLREGQRIVLHGAIATRNALSFTDPRHPVISYQWLFSALAYLVHRSQGAAGLILLKWLTLFVTVAAMAGAVSAVAKHPLARLVALGVTAPLLGAGLLFVRSQMFTYAFVPLVAWAVLSEKRWALWALVPLLALWANLHGGFMLGLALVFAMSGALWLESRSIFEWRQLVPRRLRVPGRSGRGTSPRLPEPMEGRSALPTRELVAIPVAAALATLANPFGWRLHLAAIALTRDPGRSLDHEWTPLWRLHALIPAEWEALAVLVLALALALVFLPKTKLRLWVLCALLVLTPTAERHLRLVPVLAAPVLAAAFETAIARASDKLRDQLVRPVMLASVAVAVATFALFATSLPRSLRFHGFPPPNPAPAIDVLRLNHLSGNVWNDFNWGGLLQWAAPEVRVACDGRFDQAYSERVRREVMRFGYDDRDPLRTLERYGADLVLLPATNPAIALIANTYRPLYCGEGVCLLSRRADQLALAEHGLLRLPPARSTPESFFDAPNP